MTENKITKEYLINKLKELKELYDSKNDSMLKGFISGQAAMCGHLLTEFYKENHDDIFLKEKEE